MNLDNIQELWKQHEASLEANRMLNLSLLKEVKIDKAKSTLSNLLFVPVSTLVFFIFALSYCLYFSFNNWGIWYFAATGLCLAVFSTLFIWSSMNQLKLILEVDYNASVVKLQRDISQVKSAILTNLRIAVWMIPFSPLMMIFFSKVLFNFDMVNALSTNMLYMYAVMSLLLLVVAFFASKSIAKDKVSSKWVNWLLQGSGSQVDEALGFINQIQEFEKEE